MKTNDHNKQLFRSMQEEPDKYSDQEIEAMMDDLDQVPDVDEAWRQFENEALELCSLATEGTQEFPRASLRKMAASFVGLLLVSGIAIAAVHIVALPEAGGSASDRANSGSRFFTIHYSLFT